MTRAESFINKDRTEKNITHKRTKNMLAAFSRRAVAFTKRSMTTSSILKSKDVAFIGLGAMGYPMAANLSGLRSDEDTSTVFVWNRTKSVAEQHASEFGTRAASSLDELRGCSVVFMCLPTSREVELVCKDLVLDQGAIVADCTSGDPITTRKVASSLAERKIEMVDCPVSGGPAGAKSGQLTSMIGGPIHAVSVVEPYLKRMAQKKIVQVGSIGAGHAVKAVNNTLNTAHLAIASEGLLALAELGIAPEVAIEAINGSSGRSLQTEERIPKEVLSREFNYGFPLGLMLKDVTVAVDSVCAKNSANARGKKDRMPKFFPLVKVLLEKAVELESGEADYSRVVRPLEAETGLELHAGSGVDGKYDAPIYELSEKELFRG